MGNLFQDRRKPYSKTKNDTKEDSKPKIESSFYLRESTGEWVIEITVTVPGEIETSTRFVGKTPLEAYNDFDHWTQRN